jgi:hypothetical protein
VSRWIIIFMGIWALCATIALAWVMGKYAAIPANVGETALMSNPNSETVRLSAKSTPAAAQVSVNVQQPTFPDYVSKIPKVFRGYWDEMISDKCEGREARFHFGEREFSNFEVQWEVTKVKLYSANEMDLFSTTTDDDKNQVDEVWEFKLVDGGKTLTSRKKGGSFFKRCPIA